MPHRFAAGDISGLPIKSVGTVEDQIDSRCQVAMPEAPDGIASAREDRATSAVSGRARICGGWLARQWRGDSQLHLPEQTLSRMGHSSTTWQSLRSTS